MHRHRLACVCSNPDAAAFSTLPEQATANHIAAERHNRVFQWIQRNGVRLRQNGQCPIPRLSCPAPDRLEIFGDCTARAEIRLQWSTLLLMKSVRNAGENPSNRVCVAADLDGSACTSGNEEIVFKYVQVHEHLLLLRTIHQ